MDFSDYKLPTLQKRKVDEASVLADEIVDYFKNVTYWQDGKKKERKIDHCFIRGAIKQIGVRDINELFFTLKKFDSKYTLAVKKSWLKKQIKESIKLTKSTMQ